MHTARYGFWGYLLLIIGLAGICALLIFINQDLLARRGVSAQQAWSLWGGIFAILLFDWCVHHSGGSGNKRKSRRFIGLKCRPKMKSDYLMIFTSFLNQNFGPAMACSGDIKSACYW